MSNSRAITPAPSGQVTVIEHRPKTAAEIVAEVRLIQEVMESVMKEGHHYGRIPGTPKPTLYKPGAEKLLSTFRIAVHHEIEDLSDGDAIAYRVRAIATHGPTETFIMDALGYCSSFEQRYKWREAVCDEEWDATPENRRRLKWKVDRRRKKDEQVQTIRQVRTDTEDLANTVLKMAVKRADVAVTLLATAASDIFAQDIEDLPPELRDVAGDEPPIEQPRATSAPKPVEQPESPPAPPPTSSTPAPARESVAAVAPPEQGFNVEDYVVREPMPDPVDEYEPPPRPVEGIERTIGTVDRMSTKAGGDSSNPWTRYGARMSDGQWYNTFDHKLGEKIQRARDEQIVVVAEWKQTKYGRDLVDLFPESEDVPF